MNTGARGRPLHLYGRLRRFAACHPAGASVVLGGPIVVGGPAPVIAGRPRSRRPSSGSPGRRSPAVADAVSERPSTHRAPSARDGVTSSTGATAASRSRRTRPWSSSRRTWAACCGTTAGSSGRPTSRGVPFVWGCWRARSATARSRRHACSIWHARIRRRGRDSTRRSYGGCCALSRPRDSY